MHAAAIGIIAAVKVVLTACTQQPAIGIAAALKGCADCTAAAIMGIAAALKAVHIACTPRPP